MVSLSSLLNPAPGQAPSSRGPSSKPDHPLLTPSPSTSSLAMTSYSDTEAATASSSSSSTSSTASSSPALSSPDDPHHPHHHHIFSRTRLHGDGAAPSFTKAARPRGQVRFAPFEDVVDEVVLAEMARFQVRRFGRIAESCQHIPYNSGKKDFYEKTGRESFEVFKYDFKVPGNDTEYTVMWDYNIGLVRMTPFFKCCKYGKTVPAKMLNMNPGLKDITHSITGGAITAQGYWMPYQCAKAVCATFCYRIAGALIPIFGPGFPGICIRPDSPDFGRMTIDPRIVADAAREAEVNRRYYTSLQPPSAGPPPAHSHSHHRHHHTLSVPNSPRPGLMTPPRSTPSEADLYGYNSPGASTYSRHSRQRSQHTGLHLRPGSALGSPLHTDSEEGGGGYFRSVPDSAGNSAAASPVSVPGSPYEHHRGVSSWTPANQPQHHHHHGQQWHGHGHTRGESFGSASPWLSSVPRSTHTSVPHPLDPPIVRPLARSNTNASTTSTCSGKRQLEVDVDAGYDGGRESTGSSPSSVTGHLDPERRRYQYAQNRQSAERRERARDGGGRVEGETEADSRAAMLLLNLSVREKKVGCGGKDGSMERCAEMAVEEMHRAAKRLRATSV